MASLADWIKSQTADYGQLKEAYPNAIKFGSALKKGISDIIPTTQELQNPQMLSERALNYLNPMAGTTKIVNNLNADLLKKYLSTGKLSPKEMAQYEANGLAMETPQLQRYNVQNAIRNPEMEAYKNSLDLPMYHGSDTELKVVKPFAKRGNLGSLYASGVPSTANEYAMLGAQLRNHVPERLWGDEEFMAEELADLAHKTQNISPHRNPNVLPLLGKSKNAMNAEDDFSDYAKYINSEYPDELNMDYDTFFTTGGNDAYILENADNYLRGLQTTGELSSYTGEKSVPLIKFTPDPETGTNTYVVQEPHNVRSRFAAFDPLRKNSSSLLASLLGATALANEYDKNKKLKEMR